MSYSYSSSHLLKCGIPPLLRSHGLLDQILGLLRETIQLDRGGVEELNGAVVLGQSLGMRVLVPGLGLRHAGCGHAFQDDGLLADKLHVLGRGLEVLDAGVQVGGDVAALLAAAEDAVDEVADEGCWAGLEEGNEGGQGNGGDLSGIHF